MFKTSVLRISHPSSTSLHISNTYPLRRPLSRRFHGLSPRHSKKTSSLAHNHHPVSSTHRPKTKQIMKHPIQAKIICHPLLPAAATNTIYVPPQQPSPTKQPPSKPHRILAHSAVLTSVATALALTTVCPSCKLSIDLLTTNRHGLRLGLRFIHLTRPRPRLFKFIRAVRRRRHILRFIRNCLACAAVAFFISWDVQNLSREEPVDFRTQKATREDPAAALSGAREELRRMLREEKIRYG